MLKSLATIKKFKRKVRKVFRKEKPRKSVIIPSIRVIRVLMLKLLATVKKFKRKVLRKEKPRKSVIIPSIRVIRVLMLKLLATVKKFKRKVLRKEKPEICDNSFNPSYPRSNVEVISYSKKV